ncbi:MAG TPA: hypothetical protein VMZ71_06615 [Gemmataceae bacterium]|nr:hypothetical protein [Gemmataceae bacterium]
MIPLTATQRAAKTCRPDDLECRLAKLADAGPAAINDRLCQLENEWSAGRATKVTLSFVILIGVAMTLAFGTWWAILPIVAGLFLFQYAFTRTSWMGSMFREMGFRPGAKIEEEKFALKTLRGDFRHLPTVHDLQAKEDISRFEGEGGPALDDDQLPPKVDPKDAVKEVLEATRH